jgi:iron complex outermembrane receptor protein
VSIGNRSLVRTLTRANIPLIEGRLAAGIAYLYSKQDGFIDNAGSGSDHYADRDRDGLRLDVLWAISDAVELRYAYDRSTIADSPAFLAKVNPLTDRPKIPHRGSIYDQLKDSDITADGHSLTLTWQLSEKVELKSLTTYRELESNVQNNMMTDTYSRFPGRPVIASLGDLDQDQFSQEFQITGDAFGGQLEYVAGLYYFKESGDNTGFTRTGNFIPVPITAGVTISTADNEATAVFGQATYTPSALGDRLHLTLGGRWSEDKREATLVMATAAAGVITPTGMPGDGNKTYRNVSPTAVVAYDITDDVNVYAKVARGYKSGGYNTRANGIPRFNQGFKPEELTSVELGLKSQFLDNRIRFNLAVFDADYEDIQVNTSSVVGNPSITDVLNAGKAKIKGVEAELTAVLLEGLTFHANYGYLKPEYKEIIGADGVNRANVYTPINSPKNAWSLDLEYVFPWQLPGELSANLNYSWQDEMHTSTSNPTFLIPEYSLLNARLTLADVQAFGGSFRVSLWGKNLRDKEYWLSLARVIDPYALYGEPRSYGVDFTWEL